MPDTPSEQATYLMVYRDTNDDVHFMELNPVSALLVQLLNEENHLTTKEMLENIAEQMNHPDPEVVIQGGFQVIQDLKNRNVICPLFSQFGPGPILQRMLRGDAKALLTTKKLFEKKILPIMDQLPDLQYILLIDEQYDQSEKILSLPRLLKEAFDEFEIEPTDPEPDDKPTLAEAARRERERRRQTSEPIAVINDANLQAKLAGNDAVTDHADWNGGDFVGWETANLAVDAEGGVFQAIRRDGVHRRRHGAEHC